MILKLSNEAEIRIFYKKLFIFKSFLFKHIKFETKDDINDDLKAIIKCLNIKNRKNRIKYIYDTSCDIVDSNISNNICDFKDGQCYLQRLKKSCYKYGCCRRCRYQSKDGCPTKNLACKLFNCSYVTCKYKVITYSDLKILKLLSIKNRLIVKSDFFASRKDVLRDLYCYTFTISSFRIIYRLIKDYFYVNKLLRIKDIT